MNHLDVSIIIVNYNTFQLTCNCIQSIIEETKNIDYEIILIDNASSEYNPKLFLEKFPKITLIQNEKNEGFGRANNQGMSIAKGKYILLLNSDTIIIDKAIEKSYIYFENNTNQELGVISCTQVDANMNTNFTTGSSFFLYQDYSLKKVLKNNPIINYFKYKTKKNEPILKPSRVNTISGAYMFLKKEVFFKTGGFDPDFFLYSEEKEWCLNRISKNFQIYFVPEIKFIHIHGGSSTTEVLNNNQMEISNLLGWYKAGKLKFFLHILLIITLYYPYYIIKQQQVTKHGNYSILKLIRMSKKILKFNNKFGSRPTPLKYPDD